MMAAEGPYIAAIIARMPHETQNLAAYGVAFSLAWLAESPIMMLLTASNTLVRDRQSYLALRRFTWGMNAAVTATIAIGVIPPVFRFIALQAIELPPDIARLAHLSTAVLVPWPAAIGYRRFYQGILVRHHLTRRVAYGTIVRLTSMSATAAALALTAPLPGAVIGSIALTTGVVLEAAASRLMARRVVADLLARPDAPDDVPLTLSEIGRFYYPLAITSVLSLITGPMVTFFLGRSRAPIQSLAVLPVINGLVFLFRSGGIAYQEVGVALMGPVREHARELRRVALLLAGAASLALALLLLTPLAGIWFRWVAGLTPALATFATGPARVLILLPALEYLLAYQRARLIVSRSTRAITIATAIEAAGLGVVLAVGIGFFDMVGALAAATAMILGRLAANAFLAAPAFADPHARA